jgi:hypothetical protein
MGEFAPHDVEYQMRYMVDAVRPAPNAPARLMERDPGRLRYFLMIFENPKYRVFRIVSRANEREADRFAAEAAAALKSGDPAQAECRAAAALKCDPRHPAATRLLAAAALKRADEQAAREQRP